MVSPFRNEYSITTYHLLHRPGGVSRLLGTTTALHHPFVLGYVAAEPLLFNFIPIPVLFERIEVYLHDGRENVPVTLLLHAVD